jgi:hypothetical protein
VSRRFRGWTRDVAISLALLFVTMLTPGDAAMQSCQERPTYWDDVWSTHSALGCPTFSSTTDTTYQLYERGLMVWQKSPSPSQIYVLSRYADGNRWEVFDDPLVNAPAVTPDPGCIEFRRRGLAAESGFDTLWCEPWNWKLQLGNVTRDVQNGGFDQIQHFVRGLVLQLHDGPGIILYVDRTWEEF